MYRWILCLWVTAMTGCASAPPRCDGKLTAINPPVAAADAVPAVARGSR